MDVAAAVGMEVASAVGMGAASAVGMGAANLEAHDSNSIAEICETDWNSAKNQRIHKQ
jgi:hypothetical protein